MPGKWRGAARISEMVFIKRDEIELRRVGETGFAQAIIDRFSRKSGIVFLSGETFFLRGSNDPADYG